MRYRHIEIVRERQCLLGVHDAQRRPSFLGLYGDFDQRSLAFISATTYPCLFEIRLLPGRSLAA
ncbi:hypothetical protein GGD53_002558 [Rhizobium aethiopicum]|uniref:Uncharacterized protein n=1 Tax=Rhizobium aethiopicum TaxID=1138170 RepID=A0A7W6MGW0_9HYPH|nr:hypothetical protein [Rhizobium aethiopicum]